MDLTNLSTSDLSFRRDIPLTPSSCQDLEASTIADELATSDFHPNSYRTPVSRANSNGADEHLNFESARKLCSLLSEAQIFTPDVLTKIRSYVSAPRIHECPVEIENYCTDVVPVIEALLTDAGPKEDLQARKLVVVSLLAGDSKLELRIAEALKHTDNFSSLIALWFETTPKFDGVDISLLFKLADGKLVQSLSERPLMQRVELNEFQKSQGKLLELNEGPEIDMYRMGLVSTPLKERVFGEEVAHALRRLGVRDATFVVQTRNGIFDSCVIYYSAII